MTGLQVCSGWREVISGATLLWRNAARKIELSETIVKTHLPKYGSYMCLTLMALKHRKCLSSYVPEVMVENLGVHEDCDVHFDSTRNGSYVICQSGDIHSDYSLLIKQVQNDGSIVTLRSINDPAKRLEYGPFAPSVNKGFVFWGNSGTGWIGCNDSGQVHLWKTNELNDSFPAVCPSCGLIAILLPPTAEQEDVHVVLRRVGNSGIEKLGQYILQLHRNFLLASLIEFDIFPKEQCSSHYLAVNCSQLLLDAEQMLTLHLVTSSSTNNCLLDIVKIPKEFMDQSESGFRFSMDGLVATKAFFLAGCYHIWEPDTERVVTIASQLISGLCKAIGHLYTILEDVSHLEVRETYSGVVLQRIPMKWHYIDDRFSYVEQTWLSSFSFSEVLVMLRLCTGDKTGVETIAIVGCV